MCTIHLTLKARLCLYPFHDHCYDHLQVGELSLLRYPHAYPSVDSGEAHICDGKSVDVEGNVKT
ncbi:hypothetical protein K474DRAFT_1097461 [Panus rudis PR-1116 ss-1]|nr:hypothetical protein K474DRAFT_1097461 [Panus rudis PR-1116 ss-1]